MRRRSFLRSATGAGFIAAGSNLLWAGGIEPQQIVTERINIPTPHPSLRGLVIAHFSDIHWDPYFDPTLLLALAKLLAREPADILCYTGDTFTRYMWKRDPLIGLFATLPARLGPTARYACIGNHDLWLESHKPVNQRGGTYTDLIRDCQWTLLRNSQQQLADLPLLIGGLDSAYGGDPHPPSLAQRNDLPLILLAHEPDPFPHYAGSLPNLFLQLSGHTHGGQVCLPTPMGAKPMILPPGGRLYPRGLFQIKELPNQPQLYVNRGLGTVGVPLRFASSPELTRITFV